MLLVQIAHQMALSPMPHDIRKIAIGIRMILPTMLMPAGTMERLVP
jgi:hypothetical protein